MPNSYLTNNKISASQLATWVKSPKDYIEQYIDGKPFIGNKYTEFGTSIHKKIELGDNEFKDIPKLNNKEFYFEKEYGECVLNGYLDSYDIGYIIDYKVSKDSKWSKKQYEDGVQLKFYGFWHFLEHNMFPKVSIFHIETIEDIKGNLYLTGNTIQYTKQITIQDIDYIKTKINEFINWCEDYKLNYLHKNE